MGATSGIAEHCARLWLAAGADRVTLVGRDAARAPGRAERSQVERQRALAPGEREGDALAVEVGVEAGQWQAGLLARRLALAGQAGEEQGGAGCNAAQEAACIHGRRCGLLGFELLLEGAEAAGVDAGHRLLGAGVVGPFGGLFILAFEGGRPLHAAAALGGLDLEGGHVVAYRQRRVDDAVFEAAGGVLVA